MSFHRIRPIVLSEAEISAVLEALEGASEQDRFQEHPYKLAALVRAKRALRRQLLPSADDKEIERR